MRFATTAVLILSSICAGPAASALAPSRHRSIAETSCQEAGLPRDFCRRVGVEAYVTDANEWDDMAAHAQTPGGATACDGADATGARLHGLGAELRVAIDQIARGGSGEDAAVALGRALHTIQDDCAHHGMPNAQHAWYSLEDFCTGTESSPDIQPEAIACARQQTDAVFVELRAALDAASVSLASLARDTCPEPFDEHSSNDNPCDRVWLPAPWEACDFLGSADQWDGVDHRWNDGVVTPKLRAAFRGGLFADGGDGAVCHGESVAAPDAEPDADVSGGPRTCATAHLVCLGKADEGDGLFDDLAAEPGGGCVVGEHDSGDGVAMLMLAAVAALVTCRRRRRGSMPNTTA